MRKESSPLISIRSAVWLKIVAMDLLSTEVFRGNCTVIAGPAGAGLCGFARVRTPIAKPSLAAGSGRMRARRGLDFYHVRCLGALLTINNFELHCVALLQALVALGNQGAVVHKHVRPVLTADEAESLRIVEPLYGSFQFHLTFLREADDPMTYGMGAVGILH